MSQLKAALVGCGAMGWEYDNNPPLKGVFSHAKGVVESRNSQLVALCDPNPKKANTCAKKYQVPAVYQDFSQMLEKESIDYLIVASPTSCHFEQITQALRQNSIKGVLAEKPLAETLEQTSQLVYLVNEIEKPLVLNYTRRFAPGFHELKKYLNAGLLGELVSANGFYTKGLAHNGTHWLDLLTWLVGAPETINASLPSHRKQLSQSISDDWDVSFQWGQGAKGQLTCLDTSIYSLFEMDLVGQSGRVKILDSGTLIEIFSKQPSPHFSGYEALVFDKSLDGELGQAVPKCIENMEQILTANASALCSVEDGYNALALCEKAVKNA